MGPADDHLRLPLQPLDDGRRDTLASVLTRLGCSSLPPMRLVPHSGVTFGTWCPILGAQLMR